LNPIINSSGNLPPAVLAGIETLVSGGVAGALGFNVQGAVTAAQNETLNNFCEHNSCGRALAAVGAVVGGAVTAAGSVAVDVGSYGRLEHRRDASRSSGRQCGWRGSRQCDWCSFKLGQQWRFCCVGRYFW
jgi:hypothetical protein